MNRRDIIITAVLINAGLLIVLFVCSIKPQTKELALKPQIAAKPPEAVHVKELLAAQTKDNVDLSVTTHKESAIQPVKKEPLVQTPAPIAAAPAPAVKSEKPLPVSAKIAPVAVKPTSSAATMVSIEVQPGDALEKIAKLYGIGVDDLMRANQLSDTRLKVGQKLVVPVPDKPISSPIRETTKHEDHYEYYVVKNGDNPWTIAVKNHIKVDDLLRLNDLDEAKARRLKPGDRLRIK